MTEVTSFLVGGTKEGNKLELSSLSCLEM